jgi:hypothetical protein
MIAETMQLNEVPSVEGQQVRKIDERTRNCKVV